MMWQCYAKNYRPDDTTMSSSSSPSGYDNTLYYLSFMPYDELHMLSGKYNLAFYVLLYNKADNEELERSSDQYFDYTQP